MTKNTKAPNFKLESTSEKIIELNEISRSEKKGPDIRIKGNKATK